MLRPAAQEANLVGRSLMRGRSSSRPSLQREPAHKLPNLKNIPVLDVSGEASYHRVLDSCIAKWVNQAGVKTEYVKMEDVGPTGNEHEVMLDKKSGEIAKFFVTWMDKHVH
jgi:hypothetical protein